MSGNHATNNSKTEITLPAFEAHLASISVAIVSGSIAGNLMTLFIGKLLLWVLILLTAILGFTISWVVCKYLFKTAHVWYGSGTLSHRLYDSVGIISALVALYM
jgi:hypothetical protein